MGGIRTGTWEGALVVGPWGDWRWGAFSYLRSYTDGSDTDGSDTDNGHTKAPHTLRCTGPCDIQVCQRSSTGTKSRSTTPV